MPLGQWRPSPITTSRPDPSKYARSIFGLEPVKWGEGNEDEISASWPNEVHQREKQKTVEKGENSELVVYRGNKRQGMRKDNMEGEEKVPVGEQRMVVMKENMMGKREGFNGGRK